jgi:hypothetical protein
MTLQQFFNSVCFKEGPNDVCFMGFMHEMMDWLRERKLNQEGNTSQGKTQISEAKNCQMREREREREICNLAVSSILKM